MNSKHSLYLVRHAIAEERGDEWPDDAKRPLTSHGISRMKRVVRGLRELGVELDVILTSPLVRAAQTAEILADGLDRRPDIVRLQALAPGHAPSRVADALTSHRKHERIALVGHEPDLGDLAAYLIGTAHGLRMRKGGVCRIDTEDWPPSKGSELVWLLTPRIARRIG